MQQRAKDTLGALVENGRVPHALLFLAPSGAGGLALASSFAQLLQCASPDAGAFSPCGQCSACKKSAHFVHPDIHFSFPTIGTNAVSTDFLKEWRRFLAETPYADANT